MNVIGTGKTLKECCKAAGVKHSKATASFIGRRLKASGTKPTGYNGHCLLWDLATAVPALRAIDAALKGPAVKAVVAVAKDPSAASLAARVDALEKAMADLVASLGGK